MRSSLKIICSFFVAALSLNASAQSNPPNCSPAGSPTNLETTCQKPMFTWEKPVGGAVATSYDFYLGTNLEFEIFNGVNVTDTFFQMPFNLDLNGEYQWIAIPRNAQGLAENCTQYHHFTIGNKLDPTIQLTPKNFQICQGRTVRVSSYVQHGHGQYGMMKFKWDGDFIGLLDSDTIAHPTFDGVVPGDYSFEMTVTDTLGCIGKATWVGKVKEGVGEIELQGSTAICRGDSLKIKAVNQADSYNWQHSPDSLLWLDLYNQDDYYLDEDNAQDTIYYRLLASKNGCPDTSQVVKQTILELPDAPVLEFDNHLGEPYVCGSSDTVTATVVNYTDSLLFNGFYRTQSLDIYEAGLLEVVYTAPNLCTSTNRVVMEERKVPNDALVIPLEKQVICNTDSAKLKVASDVSQYELMIWSTGDTASQVFVKQSGSYSVEITNLEGCTFEYDGIEVEVVAKPDEPELNIPNNGLGCANEGITVSVLNYGEDLYWDGVVSQRGTSWHFDTEGVHFVTFDFNENCTATTEFQIKLNPSPPAPVIETPNGRHICEDDSLLFFVNSQENEVYWFGPETGDTTFMWVENPGRYYAVFRNGFGCEDTSFVDIKDQPTPLKPELVQEGNKLIATASQEVDVYRWYLDGMLMKEGFSNEYVIPESGNWSATVVINSCESEFSEIVEATGVSELSLRALNVYPNPSTGTFVVEGGAERSLQLDVVDINGRQIAFGITQKVNGDCEIRIAQSGVYFLVSGRRVQKLVVLN